MPTHDEENISSRVNDYFAQARYRWLFAKYNPPLLFLFLILTGCYLIFAAVSIYEGSFHIPPKIVSDDLKNVPLFIDNLRSSKLPLSRCIWSQLSPETTNLLTVVAGSAPEYTPQAEAMLLGDLNRIIRRARLWESNLLEGVNLSKRAASMVNKRFDSRHAHRFNRSLLAQAYPEYIGPKPVAFSEDVYIPAVFLVVCFGFIMTRKLLYNVERLFHELPDMLKPDQSLGLEKKIERMRSDISLKGTSLHWLRISLFALCLAFVLIFQVLFPITHQIPPAWGTLPGRFPLSYAASIAAGVLWFLIIVRIFLWHIFAAGFAIFPIIRGFAKSNKLWIVPNAPDGQGGLSAVGRVAFGMASALSLGTIIFIAWVFLYGVDIVALIGGGTYTLILAMVFFWPLHSTHEAMLNAKRDELEIWSHSFFREYAQVKHMLNQKSPEDADAQEAINKQMQYLSEIEKIYTSIHNMPVWPFDTATVQKFMVIASAPIASSLIHIYWPALGSGIESAIGNLAK